MQLIEAIKAKIAGKPAPGKKIRRPMTRWERRATMRRRVAQTQRGNRVHSRASTREWQAEFIAEQQRRVVMGEIPGTEQMRANILSAMPAERRAALEKMLAGR